jgi:hypothetical protein
MIQAIPFQRARISVLALGALGLVAFATVSAPRLFAPAPDARASSLEAPALTFAQRPILQKAADTTACGAGAYVSGDMAGEASPTAIYAAMCGGR